MVEIVGTMPGGTPRYVVDATLNDSDKSFTVPTGHVWEMLSIHAQLTTDATVGNRFLAVLVTDATPTTVASIGRTAAIAASKTGVLKVDFGSSGYDATATQVVTLTANAPDIALREGVGRVVIPAGYVVRVYDQAAIAAATDDLTVVLHYLDYTVGDV